MLTATENIKWVIKRKYFKISWFIYFKTTTFHFLRLDDKFTFLAQISEAWNARTWHQTTDQNEEEKVCVRVCVSVRVCVQHKNADKLQASSGKKIFLQKMFI